MMEFKSAYVAKKPNKAGYIDFTSAENEVWTILIERQMKIIQNRACDEFIRGLEILNYPHDHIPQLPEVSARLVKTTGWTVAPVEALISAKEFFTLLAERKFPAATFIRSQQDIDYVKEPDIFHELFGHCPLLTDQIYADFVHAYAELVLTFPESEWALLQRFFWFTVEFGLINTANGLRVYGGGILSSKMETPYCVESDEPARRPFDVLNILRTPYRIDMLQSIYYVIDDFKQLYGAIDQDFSEVMAKAHQLGEFEPSFPVDKDNPNIHILAC